MARLVDTMQESVLNDNRSMGYDVIDRGNIKTEIESGIEHLTAYTPMSEVGRSWENIPKRKQEDIYLTSCV